MVEVLKIRDKIGLIKRTQNSDKVFDRQWVATSMQKQCGAQNQSRHTQGAVRLWQEKKN